MKNNNKTNTHGIMTYLAGVSSPTAANLTVQGLAGEPRIEARTQSKKKKTFRIPFSYIAGISSPSATNPHVQGLSARGNRNTRL